ESGTVAGGAAAGFLVALLAIWLVARRQARAPARELLASGAESRSQLLAPSTARRLPGLITAALAGGAAVALLAAAAGGEREKAAGAFFGAGALLLVAGIAACRALLARLERATDASHLTLGSLGIRNSVRRRGR